MGRNDFEHYFPAGNEDDWNFTKVMFVGTRPALSSRDY